MTILFENKAVKTSRLTLTLAFILSTGNVDQATSGVGTTGFPGASGPMGHTGTRYMRP